MTIGQPSEIRQSYASRPLDALIDALTDVTDANKEITQRAIEAELRRREESLGTNNNG